MKILIAYDEQKSSPNLLYEALIMAKKFEAYVYLVIVCSAHTKKTKIEKIENELQQLGKSIFKESNIQHETHVLVRGHTPGEDIVKYASEKSVAMIVMGVKNKSKLGKLVFGSNAQYVILNAPCPVLTVRLDNT